MFMFMKKVRKNKKGFTLTELIVVVAILGVLAAVATPSVMGYVGEARTSADAANAKIIENAIKIAAARDADNTFVTTAGAIVPTTVANVISGATNEGSPISGSLLVAAGNAFRPCQNAANHYYLNRATLEIRIATAIPAPAASWLALN